MKRTLPLLILMAASTAFAADFGLEEPATPSPASTASDRSAEEAVKFLAKRLSLSEDQKSKILPIMIERRRMTRQVWSSSEQSARQKRVQVRGVYIESDRRINALLTGEQQKAYAALEQERKVKRRYRQAQSDSTSN